MTQAEKAARFQRLHVQAEPFIVPNPWDVGSARLFEALGFKALATTSSGFALTLGRLDGAVSLEENLAHCRELSAATTIPVSADLENGYGDRPEAVVDTIRLAAATGIVGGSIEDYDGSAIYDFSLAVERVAAAVEAVRGLAVPFTLTARAENLIRNRPNLDDTIRRLQAYEAAGADVLYAPGLKTLEEVRLVASELSKPINVLIPYLPTVTVAELADAGAKRISIGGALARLAYAALLQPSREMAASGSFGWLARLAGSGDVNALLRQTSGA